MTTNDIEDWGSNSTTYPEPMIEVFRLTPTVGKTYMAAIKTQKVYIKGVGSRYYIERENLIYMGKFVKGVKEGHGDGGKYYELYERDGEICRLDYDYEGMTCLLEVEQTVE